jgi:hypothetical protein
MITKINEKNQAYYNELFAAAQNVSGKQISSLHDFFDALSDETVRSNPQNYHLFRPFDDGDAKTVGNEPLFIIDANAREISVPAVFQKNGLTVVGDHLAEMIWFRIDRYFDLMDFSLFDNARIGSLSSGSAYSGAHCLIEWYNPTAVEEQNQRGVDFAYAMITTEDYVYFAWPLANKVAGDSGSIQFAVRFLNIEGNNIIFNYSTKIASCEVKTTLNFDLQDSSYVIDSWEETLYSRPIYSTVINSVESPAAILIQGIETADRNLTPVTREVPVEGGEEGETEEVTALELPITVAATTSASQEGQTLSFLWQYNGRQVAASEVTTDQTNGVALTSEDREEMQVAASDTNAKKSTFVATRTGTYSVLIGNKMENKNAVRYINTGVITIPTALEIKLVENGMVNRGYAGTVTLHVDLEKAVNGKVTYEWHRIYDGNDTIAATHEYNEGDISGMSDEYAPDTEGIFYCIAYNYKNGDTTNSYDANATIKSDIRVEPTALNSLTFSYDNNLKQFSAAITHDWPGHSIEYTWKRVFENAQHEMQEEVVRKEVGGASDTYIPSAAGTYSVSAREIVFAGTEIVHYAPVSLQRTSAGIYIDDNFYHAED